MQVVPNCAKRVCFVLAEPSHPGNIGSAARAIKTMGFTDLRVVSPKEPNYRTHPEAVALATTSVDVLTNSKSFATLREAFSDVTFAIALSGYSREYGPALKDLHSCIKEAYTFLEDAKNTEGRIAFLFGCERSGLTNEELTLCSACAAIAANPESPSLNLAQAVQIVAYEMHMAILQNEKGEGFLYDWQERFAHEAPASIAALEGFLTHWEKAMISCEALDPKEPKNIMAMSRALFERAHLTQSEVDLLRGICAAIICSKTERIGSKKAKTLLEKSKFFPKEDGKAE